MRKIMLAAAIAAVGMASGAQAQEKLKFAVFTPDSEMTHQVIMKPWAEKVSKESGGTLEIQTFPNGALGRNPGLQTKMLQDGVADIVWVIPSYTPASISTTMCSSSRTSSRTRPRARWRRGGC